MVSDTAPDRAEAAAKRQAADALSRLCARLMLAATLSLAGFMVFGICLLGWLVLTGLVVFLGGPGFDLAPGPFREPFYLAPPLLATAGLLFLALRRATSRWQPRSSWSGAGGWLVPTPISDPVRMHGAWVLAALALGCLVYLAYARLVFLFHRLHGAIDEGLYLYAARLVMSGQVPYRDFYFDQAPLYPYILGAALSPFQFEESAARVFAILGALASLLVTYLAAERLGGRVAGLIGFGLLLTNLDYLTELSAGVQSNGSFAALLVALTALAIATERGGLALLLGALAAGVRPTLAPLAVLAGAYLTLARSQARLALFGGLALALSIYGTFLALGGERAVFGILRPLRTEAMVRWAGAPKGLFFHLMSFRDTALEIAVAYLPFFLAAVPALYLIWSRRHPRWQALATLAAASLAVLLANLLPYPSNPRFPVTQLPLLAVLGGVGLAALIGYFTERHSRLLASASALTIALLLGVAPFLATRDPTFIHEYGTRPPVQALNEVSDFIRGLAAPNATLLSLETPLATQSGLRVLPGLEAGSWGLVRGWTDEQARAMGTITMEMVIEMLEQQAGDVAVESDGYGFLTRSYHSSDAQYERARAALNANYVRLREFQPVADWGNVRVYVKRTDARFPTQDSATPGDEGYRGGDSNPYALAGNAF